VSDSRHTAPRREERSSLILVRLSAELTTKSRGTRKRFTRRLVDNIREAFRSQDEAVRVESQWTRILIRAPAWSSGAVLARVPGISSFSPIEGRCSARLDEILRVGAEIYSERVKGRSYAIRARRAGQHGFSSYDVQRELGAVLNPGARVDLHDPEVAVEVEVRDDEAYFFSKRVEGLGGLPLGVEGKAVCLLSGGFDSGAAAWLLLKRGVEMEYVFCNLAGDAYERAVVQVAKVLADSWSYGARPRLHVIDFGPALDELRRSANPKYWQVVLKRLMYRVARRIGEQSAAIGIVTGESIGQVSSQTLPNLAAIEAGIDVPVFRPLIGFDKRDIVQLTRRIGTHDISAKVKEYCAIAPGHPVTSATTTATRREESKLDLGVLEAAIDSRRTIDLHAITTADIVDSYLLTDRIPSDAVILDIRPEADWGAWHYPGAQRMDSWEVTATPSRLDRDRKYVLYCNANSQAAVLAEELQRRGFEAYAFRGGTRALRRVSDEAGEV
jgi:tRNA uracil 4-sulfurtransferase